MNRSRLRGRRLGGILAASLFILSAMPGLATAQNNSRSLFLGSPDAQSNDTILLPTKVTVPDAAPAPINSTQVVVQLKSIDNQTIAHTIVTINWNAQGRSDLTFNTMYDPTGDTGTVGCTRDGNVITCDYGNLPAFAVRTVAVVVDVARDFDVVHQTTPLFSASALTNNETGPNQQLFLADSGTFKVSAFGENSLNTFVPPGQAKQLFTRGVASGNVLSTNVSFKSAGEVVSIVEDDSTAEKYLCPADLHCQTPFSEVKTTSGAFGTTPYFTWTLTALVPKTYSLSQGFVVHYDSLTHSDWRLLFKDRSALCGTDLDAKMTTPGQCILVAPTLAKYDKTNNLLVVTVVMNHQGGMKY